MTNPATGLTHRPLNFTNPFIGEAVTSEALWAQQSANLETFKEHYPNIYNALIAHGERRATIKIDNHTGQADIIRDSHSLYRGDAYKTIKTEIEGFLADLGPGKPIMGMQPAFAGDFLFPRFFNRLADALVTQSPLKKADLPSHYTLPDFYPHLVFLGCGFGLHIEYLLTQYLTHRVMIVEPDIDILLCSFLVVDWKQLIESRISANLPKINFLIGGYGDIKTQHQEIWNYLITQCPVFPLTTLYYNHRIDPNYKEMCRAFDTKLYVYLSGWGQYDDEINQWNQALHNLYRNYPPLQIPAQQLQHQPVAIVGSGPSLDRSADQLRAMASTHLLISCGSSITALYKLGIKPDLHIELESDYLITIGYLDRIEDADYFQDIVFIGPIHLNPLIFNYFSHIGIFLKSISAFTAAVAQAQLDTPIPVLHNITPTCVNLALSFVLKYGATDIALFGTDFGFYDLDNHHSKESVYYDSEAHESFRKTANINRYGIFEIESVRGSAILTQPLYYSAKERVEHIIAYYRNLSKASATSLRIDNYSDGAKINGTNWIDIDKITIKNEQINLTSRWKKEDIITALIANDNNSQHSILPNEISAPTHSFDKITEAALKSLEAVTTTLSANLESQRSTLVTSNTPLQSFDLFCNRIIIDMQAFQKSQMAGYCFLRGSIWHFLYIGYSHLLGLYSLPRECSEKQQKLLNDWIVTVEQFLSQVTNHYKSITYKDFSDPNDPWIHKALTDPE